jgi:hypothetical protein
MNIGYNASLVNKIARELNKKNLSKERIESSLQYIK